MSRAAYPLPPFFRETVVVPVIPKTIYYDDGITFFRLDVRDGRLYLDQRKTVTPGWAGVSPTDWKAINSW